MASNRLWISVTVVIMLSLGAMTVVGQTSGGGFTVSAEQLQINQRISAEAVRRSNRALNYLAPIRTTATDAADDGSAGVKGLSSIAGSGQGWTVDQLAKGQKQHWVTVTSAGLISAQSSPSGAYTVSRAGAGNYVVDFKTDVSKCSWIAAPYYPVPPGTPTPAFAFTIGVPGQLSQVNIRVISAAPAPLDQDFTVQVLC